MSDHRIALRVSRILNLFLISLILILMRIWYLSVVQYDQHFLESRKPQRRTLIESVERATIRDRFNEPLAINQIQYNAAICYADIRQIPSIRWEKDGSGKLQKIFARKLYIEELARFLSKELGLEATAIEDLIHGKASLFPRTPFVIKENIPEALYARLKALEKEWLGIQTQRVAKRVYPLGKCGCDVIGYLGAINQNEYLKIAQEMQELKSYLTDREEGKVVFLPKGYASPLEVRKRLKELEERAYTINDLVGKSGVEAAFDQTLRGIYGKKTIEVDHKGNFLRELPGGRHAVSGQRLVLSISAKLQQTAEELLAEYELFQDKREKTKAKERSHPWIRGSSIVAMHPKTGEILAFASFPRYDPNDFIEKDNLSNIRHWLENEAHIAEIWDGKRSLERELFSPETRQFYDDSKELTWDHFLDAILEKKSELRAQVAKIATVEEALKIQEDLTAPQLLRDLMRLIARAEELPQAVRQQVGSFSLDQWRHYNQIACRHRGTLRTEIRQLFHQLDFQNWRNAHFKEFLKEKRALERANKRYARPYTDYLQSEENRQFQEFWQKNRLLFFHVFATGKSPKSSELEPYFQKLIGLSETIADKELKQLQDALGSLDFASQLHLLKAWRSFEELDRPLEGHYPMLRSQNGVQLEKHLAASFYPYTGFGYGRSQAYRQATPQGSVFKLIPSYAALRERFEDLKTEVHSVNSLNPLTLTDENKGNLMGYFANGETIHRYYKGGLLPRKSALLGKLDLKAAIERSSNLYFSILASDVLHNSSDLTSYASLFGLGEKTGIELPGEYKGALPTDIAHNRTGLYSFAIGQHSLVVTPLQTAVMLSAIANGGKILKPQIVKLSAGKQVSREEDALFFQNDFPYKDPLALVGITFPLFTQPLSGHLQGHVDVRTPEVKSTIPFPDEVRRYLIESMHLVTNGPKGGARPSIINSQFHDPAAIRDYHNLHTQIVGKTGTAEILYKQTIDPSSPAHMEKHVWFAGISFTDETLEDPELVIVVYLRFGESGKEGAPLAAKIAQKWREISAEAQQKNLSP